MMYISLIKFITIALPEMTGFYNHICTIFSKFLNYSPAGNGGAVVFSRKQAEKRDSPREGEYFAKRACYTLRCQAAGVPEKHRPLNRKGRCAYVVPGMEHLLQRCHHRLRPVSPLKPSSL